jgi:hypothetical protein
MNYVSITIIDKFKGFVKRTIFSCSVTCPVITNYSAQTRNPVSNPLAFLAAPRPMGREMWWTNFRQRLDREKFVVEGKLTSRSIGQVNFQGGGDWLQVEPVFWA